MDGSDIREVISLNSTITDYTSFIFTLDYSQQLLYWIYHTNGCYYTIESSSTNDVGSEKTVLNYSTFSRGCHYRDKQAIDFFRGALYHNFITYFGYTTSRRHQTIFKITAEETPKITRFNYTWRYICHVESRFSNMYSGIKVISPDHQLQGIHPSQKCLEIKDDYTLIMALLQV